MTALTRIEQVRWAVIVTVGRVVVEAETAEAALEESGAQRLHRAKVYPDVDNRLCHSERA